MIYRGGGAALSLICEQVLVKLPYLEQGGFVAGVEAGFTFLPVAPGEGCHQEPGKARWALQKPQVPASLIQAPLFWDRLNQLF